MLEDYLKSLNPKPEDQAILVYGRYYRTFRDGVFLGVAQWVKDENIGDSFQGIILGEFGVITNEVFIPDRWELIITNEK